MIYLTSKQEEALSPVKREVYQRRLMRDLERRQEEAIRRVEVKVPKYTPIYAGIASCIMWAESSRLEALTKEAKELRKELKHALKLIEIAEDY